MVSEVERAAKNPTVRFAHLEHAIVLSGRLAITLGEQRYSLSPGDSMQYLPPAAVEYRNDSDSPLELLLLRDRSQANAWSRACEKTMRETSATGPRIG